MSPDPAKPETPPEPTSPATVTPSSGAAERSAQAAADSSADHAAPAPDDAVPATPEPPIEPPAEPMPESPSIRPALDAYALDTLFREARTHNAWTDQPVTDEDIRGLYDLFKMGPTSANASPGRFLFLRTPDAKQKLRPALSAGNMEKTMKAPVTVIVAYDPRFYDYLPRLFPHADARAWFANNADLAEETAFRNSSLQGAYLVLAARALGFDAGPMSGFDRAKVDELFLEDRGWKSNFLINLGHGDPAVLHERNQRLFFDEAALML